MQLRSVVRLLPGLALLVALVTLTACRSDEEEARQHLARAEELLAAGEARAAFLELKNALAQDPTSAQINFLLGEALVGGSSGREGPVLLPGGATTGSRAPPP